MTCAKPTNPFMGIGVSTKRSVKMFENLQVEFAALVGFAALVSFVINALKVAGVVKDGTADKWVAGFNLAGLVAFIVVRTYLPEYDIIPIDNVLGQVAYIGIYILDFVVMLLGSKLTYIASKGLPVIGKSNSSDGVG